jgi:hypothetical protein
LYSSIAYVSSKHKRLLTESSAEFRDIVLAIQTNSSITPCKDLARHTPFAMKCAAKLTHHASYQYNINKIKPCVTKTNSFATSLSLIQALNGKHLLPIESIKHLLQQQFGIVCWKALEDFSPP